LVEDDGTYLVMSGDEVLQKTRVRDLAEIEYGEHRERLWAERPGLSPSERQRREAAHYDLQAVRSDAFARRAKAARPKGGRGGRGGV
jgi:hypothetical protein